MSTTIEINKKSVREFLRSGKKERFIIPEYQRPYAWTDEEVQTLFDDLVEYTQERMDSPYFLGTIVSYPDAEKSPLLAIKGIRYDSNKVDYPGCPDASDNEMEDLFECINEVLDKTKSSVIDGRRDLLKNLHIRKRKSYMNSEGTKKSNGRALGDMSPLTATLDIPTEYLLKYLKKHEKQGYRVGELLRGRERTIVYQVNAKFRGDPYPGAIAAIDYLLCREGKTYEDRRYNLVLAFGLLEINHENKIISFSKNTNKSSTIELLVNDVKGSENKNLLTKDYGDLKQYQIPRYYMQMRYGSTYSKVKHIRVYSYFADAILFPDGSLWRDG